MKKLYKRIMNLGVYPDMPFYEMQRIRFCNFIGLFSQSFYLLYVVLGFVLNSPFISIVTFLMIVTGIIGYWMNHARHYNFARTMFIASFSILLFFLCNSLNLGVYFMYFYFPAFIAYALYYDLEKDLPNALVNLSVSVVCAVCAFLLPNQYFLAEQIDEKWFPFVSTLNYFLSFAITIIFVFFAVMHTNKSGRQLVEVWQKAERQKLELFEAKAKADSAVLAKSRFLSNMSHEMRTPLNGIIGTVHLMLQDSFPPEQKQNLEVLKYSSEHMLSVVNDVLDFSKIEADKMDVAIEDVNVKDMLDEIYKIFRIQFDSKDVKLQMNVDPSLDKYFKSDETRLKQVLNNLIGNAFKFTDRGYVKISSRLERSTSDMAEVYFEVEDTGIGMTEEQQETVFEAFNQAETSTTRTYGGTGLGLSISRKIVMKLGGNLKLKSSKGKGSTFYFTINMPLAQVTNKPMMQVAPLALSSLQGTKVLVAEDSTVNMTITRKFLKLWNVEIDEAVNGLKAVELFMQNKYNLVLIDLDMPVMDGYEALKEIRKIDQNIPAIAFTAAVLPQMKTFLEEKGFNDFLQKPFRPEDLHRKIALYREAA